MPLRRAYNCVRRSSVVSAPATFDSHTAPQARLSRRLLLPLCKREIQRRSETRFHITLHCGTINSAFKKKFRAYITLFLGMSETVEAYLVNLHT